MNRLDQFLYALVLYVIILIVYCLVIQYNRAKRNQKYISKEYSKLKCHNIGGVRE